MNTTTQAVPFLVSSTDSDELSRSEKLQRLTEEKKRRGDLFPKIGILIVSYNASKHIVDTLGRIPEALIPFIHELFVFDDFSQDDTYKLAQGMERLSKWESKFRAFKNERNLGYGGNQKLGFTHAIERGMDGVILLHGDGQYAPELLCDFLYEFIVAGRPVVFGSRMLKKTDALKGRMPFYKWLGNIVLTAIQNRVLGLSLSEFHSGYRMYSTELLRQLPFRLNTDQFHFDTEIIVQCRALGVVPSEIPIPTHYGEEVCRVNGLQYARDAVWAVLRYRLHQLGMLFDSRYQVVGPVRYAHKRSSFSSHGQIFSMISPQAEVLDVGCGSGGLSRALSAKRVRSVGLDFETKSRTWDGFDSYIQDDLERTQGIPTDRTFDFVILADVLEHLRNPNRLLKLLQPLVKQNGRLIASTGNVALWYVRLSLLLGRFNYGPRGILDETHVHLYTRESFMRLITQAGYQIESVRVTSLPFELVFKSTGRNRLLALVDALYFRLARWWPKLFAYQFIVEASVRSSSLLLPESGSGPPLVHIESR